VNQGDSTFVIITLENLVESCLNFSDHRPITLQLMLHADSSKATNVRCSKMFKVRWHKGSLADYYQISGELLYSIPVNVSSSAHAPDSTECVDSVINSYYGRIVQALLVAEKFTIPSIPYTALKPSWCDYLDKLKQDSIFWHNMWLSCDRPSSGYIFQIKNSAKYKYKLAIRHLL